MPTQTKHERLAETIRQRIDTGEYTDQLPSEAELTAEFGFSRSTVRQAFTSLENEGLIVAHSGSRRQIQRGRRWYWPMSSWENSHTADADAWAVSIREQGGTPSAEVSVHIEEAKPDIARALRIEPGGRVVVRRRVRLVNGEPHQLADSYFPFWLAEQHSVFLQPGDLSASGGLLASVGLPQARYLDEISARMPTPSEAQQLKASRGIPLIVHSRTGYHADERPLRHMVTLMTADRVHVCYELEP
jgi:GntR family transcriptional regulator